MARLRRLPLGDDYERLSAMRADIGHLLALRQRPGGLPVLVGTFLEHFRKAIGKAVEAVSVEAMGLLKIHQGAKIARDEGATMTACSALFAPWREKTQRRSGKRNCANL